MRSLRFSLLCFIAFTLLACVTASPSDGGGGSGGSSPPTPPPPPSCLNELPPGACPALDYPVLQHRCAAEFSSMCGLLPANPTAHVLAEGQWDAACASPPPFAMTMGQEMCDAGSVAPDVLVFCW